MEKARTAAAALSAGLMLTGCGAGGPGPDPAAGPDSGPGTRTGSAPAAGDPRQMGSGPAPEIPGLGPRTFARIGPATRQVLVVTGATMDTNRATAVLHERDRARGWKPVLGPWPARNALRGWTEDHRLNDLRSPIGMYGLTDAGGRSRDPGTELPYHRWPGYTPSGTNSEGESIAGAFDHVVAINYNRKAGVSPQDWTRPLGEAKGGGIWVHVDHGGPTQGCVSLSKARVAELLRQLDPGARPVVVMGPAASLAR
ncbi:L,D-transpeptidase family protein [Streptomyces sp. CAU 1734]